MNDLPNNVVDINKNRSLSEELDDLKAKSDEIFDLLAENEGDNYFEWIAAEKKRIRAEIEELKKNE